MANSSGNNDVSVRSAADFWDYQYWKALAGKHLPRHVLPKPDSPCTVESTERWLHRLDMTPDDYAALTNTTLAEFIALNPRWPLCAFIGTVMEIKE